MSTEPATARSDESGPAGNALSDEADPAREPELSELRGRIDDIDRSLARLLARRTELAVEVGRRKRAAGVPLLDPAREAAVVRRAADRARSVSLDEEAVRQIYWCLIRLSRSAQRNDRR